MQKLKCIILEDNLLDMELMVHFINKETSLELLQTFNNPLEAFGYIKTYQPPFLIMDIDMPVMTGIELYKKLDYTPICVFVTAHPDYALDSYEVHAFDFILKPFSEKRIAQTIQRVHEYIDIRNKAMQYSAQFEQQIIVLKEGTTNYRVPLHEILYMEALKDYTKVVTPQKKYITLNTLKDFLDKLPTEDFIRIHRSYAVAKSKVEKFGSDELTVNKILLPIGRSYRNDLNWINN